MTIEELVDVDAIRDAYMADGKAGVEQIMRDILDHVFVEHTDMMKTVIEAGPAGRKLDDTEWGVLKDMMRTKRFRDEAIDASMKTVMKAFAHRFHEWDVQ
jgi:hypothetical protein